MIRDIGEAKVTKKPEFWYKNRPVKMVIFSHYLVYLPKEQ